LKDPSALTAGVAITKPLVEAERPVHPVAEARVEAPEAVTRTILDANGTASGVSADRGVLAVPRP
jgi:hypothetical protein